VIDEARVERAVNWMAESADKAAQARANREYLEEYRRVLRAQLMREHADLPLAAQEREAYADDRYQQHLVALQEAIEQDEKMRWLRASAETMVSAWQTQNRKVNV
jgi:hypothetical protein